MIDFSEPEKQAWIALTMGAGRFDSDGTTVNHEATGVGEAEAGVFLVLS
jgi:hypothetical protein